MKQRDSLPDLPSALEYQKCLLSSCETWIATSGWTERQICLISAFCYRFRMKAINLLIINNSYIFSGVGIWKKILKNNMLLWRSVWFFWAARHIQTCFSYPLPIPAGCQALSHICVTAVTPLPESHFFPVLPMNVERAPDTPVLHKNAMMQAHGKQNAGDCSPKSDTE